MSTRRTFLATLLAAPVAALALTRTKAETPCYILGIDPAAPGETDHYAEHWARVQGLSIKVPFNRIISLNHFAPVYVGDWDGTFKLEAGCSNPAYILADLMERTAPDSRPHLPDWVVDDEKGVLNWPMLYNWGCWCDELVGASSQIPEGDVLVSSYGTRFTTNTVCQTREDMERLRDDLRMRCLHWQSTDPRYRTSWPGIPYRPDVTS